MDGKQLKNSILQWAIQGKLVPQNPKDEPASKLLERITKVRNESLSPWSEAIGAKACHPERSAVKSKDLKKKKASPISRIYRENGIWYEQVGNAEPKDISEDIPFEIPESWAWCRFSQVISVASNLVDSSKYLEYKHIAPDNIEKGTGKLFSCKTVAEDKVISNNHLFRKGQIIYSKIRPLLRKCVIAPFDGLCSADMYPLKTDIEDAYVVKLLLSDMFNKQVADICASRVKMPKINQEELSGILLPLPPLAEQKRIVAKLEQVLPLADEYGAAQEELDKLNKELPEALKKSILQQAIQGKLVPQNPKDEPAQKLLERITQSRHSEQSTSSTSLRGAKTTKQSKKSAPTSRIYRENGTWYEQIDNASSKDITDEIPFEIPETWTWCRFDSICEIARGGSPRPIQDYLTDSSEGYNWIKIGDTEKGGKYINSTKERIKLEGLTKTRLIHKGDFLLTNSMSFGRPYISNIDGCIHDGWLVISILGNAFVPDYLYYLLSSQYAYRQFCGRVAGAVVKNLNIDKVAESLIPLPPLAEQKRIVTKLEQLFKVI